MAPHVSLDLEHLPAGSIDWNAAWRAARERATRRTDREAWDRRAHSFARYASRSGYVERMLEVLAPEPGWTVLDVGCGPGTLAAPLAARVRSVTAVDHSPRMLELLRERCAKQGIANVTPVLAAWEDDWEANGIGAHDVALASRSLSVPDLREALLKLDRAARRRVVVTAPVGDGPVDRRILEATGREFVPGPDYRYVVNLLRQMGVAAELAFIPVADERRYASLDEAVEALAWVLSEPCPGELERLRAWAERELVPAEGGLALAHPRTVEWAVVSWDT